MATTNRISSARYTLREIWLYTYEKYRNRFDYRERDVLKSISIREIKSYDKNNLDNPIKRFDIITSSYPQYEPYVSLKGKHSKKQRKVKHTYNSVFQFESLNWNSKIKWRVGSQRKYPTSDTAINYNKIKQLHSSVREKLVKKYGKGTPELKKAIEAHRKKAKYIDKGDYISQVYGIMGDWYFRCQGNAYLSGNLFGLAWNKDKHGDGVPFFDKHSLRVIEYLLKKGIIKRDRLANI